MPTGKRAKALMTAGLVILIWGLAGPALSEIFANAISKVTGL